MSDNNIFYSNDLSITPDSVSSKYCTEYEKKVLIYLLLLIFALESSHYGGRV
jgi:hypothetical protein